MTINRKPGSVEDALKAAVGDLSPSQIHEATGLKHATFVKLSNPLSGGSLDFDDAAALDAALIKAGKTPRFLTVFQDIIASVLDRLGGADLPQTDFARSLRRLDVESGVLAIRVFEAGWKAMDAAVKAALDGTAAPAASQGGTVGGYQIPEGMSESTFTSLFKDGASLFRAGKSPGDHADAEDPAKARILQLGWAAEQDEQQKARDTEAVVEAALTPDEMQAIRAAGAAACRDGKARSDCEHADGSVQADLWLEGYDVQENALFDTGADNLTAADGGEGASDDTDATEPNEALALVDGEEAAAEDADFMEPPAGEDDDAFPVGAMTGPSPAEIFAAE